MRYDYIVVGNGPAGCIAAANAACESDVLLVGKGFRRVQCAGLVSVSGLEKINVKPKDSVVNVVRGAKIFSPSGIETVIDGKKPKAYVLDRMAFDEMLLEKALDAGVKYKKGFVESIKPQVKIKGQRGQNADVTVLASGTDYSLQHRHGLETPGEYLVGGQYEMKVECDTDFVELYFNVPHFFSWIIPLGDTARVGLCVRGNPRPYLDSFVKKITREKRLKSARRYSESFGVIPVHNPKMRTEYDGVKLVGDAAGQVKASTGGGIVMGGLACKHIVSPEYERLWRDEIGFELRLHLMIHHAINRMSDHGKDRFFNIVSEYHRNLESSGDMDLASKTICSLLKDPRFIVKAAANLPWILMESL
ncbi:MAG: NAD(P)/FAD-dependent oxidoreductase [Candidatus Altiarchaeota archaeon]|nr:NAD(P)/FAD-dependent oxidoreductase [Candidatus Altiarchaeota archaeon]